eukprot:TRINITY_DN4103_c0_g1_i4.p1 TRINITY_DN4103_c0_g1~~TRINITY_DN4103_c0_g1_i4.p1  ORF type:complete len:190 (-),score=29.80 TRINITY_DN4103_c0_g1_i4:1144-1713(-)
MTASSSFLFLALVGLACTAQGFLMPTQPGVASRSGATAVRPAVSRSKALYAAPAPPQRQEQSENRKVKLIENGTDGFLEAMASNADRPVVIKFYDTFCRACKAIAPKFERMAQENPGVSFYEVEFRENKPLCKSLGITMLPTIQIYRGAAGKVASMPVGPKRFHLAEEALASVLAQEGNSAAIHIPDTV